MTRTHQPIDETHAQTEAIVRNNAGSRIVLPVVRGMVRSASVLMTTMAAIANGFARYIPGACSVMP